MTRKHLPLWPSSNSWRLQPAPLPTSTPEPKSGECAVVCLTRNDPQWQVANDKVAYFIDSPGDLCPEMMTSVERPYWAKSAK